jgi:phosphoenolpyruvate synthase/pyruvate phosphate dikinase
MANPDWLPTIRRAAALVTDGGGTTCHAAIVARELGVPCVVGARDATTALRDGQPVTVDGGAGEVLPATAPAPARTSPARPPAAAAPEPLGTRLYVNLALPEQAEAVAAGPSAGLVAAVADVYPGLGIEDFGPARVVVQAVDRAGGPERSEPVRGLPAVLAAIVDRWADGVRCGRNATAVLVRTASRPLC